MLAIERGLVAAPPQPGQQRASSSGAARARVCVYKPGQRRSTGSSATVTRVAVRRPAPGHPPAPTLSGHNSASSHEEGVCTAVSAQHLLPGQTQMDPSCVVSSSGNTIRAWHPSNQRRGPGCDTRTHAYGQVLHPGGSAAQRPACPRVKRRQTLGRSSITVCPHRGPGQRADLCRRRR